MWKSSKSKDFSRTMKRLASSTGNWSSWVLKTDFSRRFEMKDFTRFNDVYMKLRKYLPVKLAYKLAIISMKGVVL